MPSAVDVGADPVGTAATAVGSHESTYGHLTPEQLSDLTDEGDSAAHYHSSDRARENHTGTQLAATISDFTTAAAAAAPVQSVDGLTGLVDLSGSYDSLGSAATAEANAKAHADSLVVGLYDDRGNYDASGNVFPSSGGSGAAGAVLKGDVWYISVAGTLGGVPVIVGDSVRALVDAPGQTASNWALMANANEHIGENIHAATEKTTLADADEIGIADSAASWLLKRLTWANLKTLITGFLGTAATADTGTAAGDVVVNGAASQFLTFPETGICAAITPVTKVLATGVGTGSYARAYVLLCRKYDGVNNNAPAGFDGKITYYRGLTNSIHRFHSYIVRATSANVIEASRLIAIQEYNTTTNACELCYATVAGVEYVAIRLVAAGTAARDIHIDGFVFGDTAYPQIVADADVTAVTTISAAERLHTSANLVHAQNLSGSAVDANATVAGSFLSPAQTGTWRNVSAVSIANNGYGLWGAA
jgi:hypothetical protein